MVIVVGERSEDSGDESGVEHRKHLLLMRLEQLFEIDRWS